MGQNITQSSSQQSQKIPCALIIHKQKSFIHNFSKSSQKSFSMLNHIIISFPQTSIRQCPHCQTKKKKEKGQARIKHEISIKEPAYTIHIIERKAGNKIMVINDPNQFELWVNHTLHVQVSHKTKHVASKCEAPPNLN